MNSIVKLILASAIAASSTAALQARSSEPRTLSVATADLDLSTPAGQEQLNRRIDRAVKKVCNNNSDLRDLKAIRDYNACAAKARTQALQQVPGRAGQATVHRSAD